MSSTDRSIGEEIKSIDLVSALKLLGIGLAGFFGYHWIKKKFERDEEE